MPVKVITPPAVESVTFDEVKLQVKLDVERLDRRKSKTSGAKSKRSRKPKGV